MTTGRHAIATALVGPARARRLRAGLASTPGDTRGGRQRGRPRWSEPPALGGRRGVRGACSGCIRGPGGPLRRRAARGACGQPPPRCGPRTTLHVEGHRREPARRSDVAEGARAVAPEPCRRLAERSGARPPSVAPRRRYSAPCPASGRTRTFSSSPGWSRAGRAILIVCEWIAVPFQGGEIAGLLPLEGLIERTSGRAATPSRRSSTQRSTHSQGRSTSAWHGRAGRGSSPVPNPVRWSRSGAAPTRRPASQSTIRTMRTGHGSTGP